MSDINWEQLCRNGQLVWEHSPKHRMMLERFYNYFKGTSDEQMIAGRYPAFYELMKAKEEEKEIAIETPSDVVNESNTTTLEAPKKRGRKKKSSPDLQ